MTEESSAEMLYSQMKTKYEEAELGLDKHQVWHSIKQLEEIIELAADFEYLHSHRQLGNNAQIDYDIIQIKVINLLLATARKLSSTMQIKQAMDCFEFGLRILQSASDFRAEHEAVLCALTSSYVNVALYVKDIDRASCFLSKHLPLWESLESCVQLQHTLAVCYLELGMTQLEATKLSSAYSYLETANSYFQNIPGARETTTYVKLKCSLGYCVLHFKSDNALAITLLKESVDMWKSLQWPLDCLEYIVKSLKHYGEALLKSQRPYEDKEMVTDLKQLHHVAHRLNKSMKICEVFSFLGMTAFRNNSDRKALYYFEQAYDLYKGAEPTHEKSEEQIKLLKSIGVTSYNCRDFDKASRAYMECLVILESQKPVTPLKLSEIAECCASLGFTYSRLRNFDKMLQYYERALELDTRCAPEDLELIETNIGSLYHVMAVKHSTENNQEMAQKFYGMAEKAFNKALRYSWKSFPFVNYGYYLYCRQDHQHACAILQQGYLNGVIDKDTVEFDHTEDPILIEDLQLELDGRDDIRMPSTVLSLYLKVLSQVAMGNIVGASHTATQLQHEVTSCKYIDYYTEGFGEERMKALCYSLVGYSFESLGYFNQAAEAFNDAIVIFPDYKLAKSNFMKCRSARNKGQCRNI